MSRFLESKNPLIKDTALDKRINTDDRLILDSSEVMTMEGAINKTLMLFGIMMVTTLISYIMPSTLFLWVGMLGGLAAVIFASIKPHTSAVAAPVYAAFEGLFVGAISAYFAYQFDGIVFQAVSLTFGTLFTMLMIYKTGIIKVTAKFKLGVMMATGAIMLMYVISIIGSFVGFNVPYLHDNGLIGIGISLAIIAVAALNLIIDFDAFEKGVEARAPKYMEWFVGMGLLVTLVWLYVEFLRLLSKFAASE